jgi:hypothetical protein
MKGCELLRVPKMLMRRFKYSDNCFIVTPNSLAEYEKMVNGIVFRLLEPYPYK